MPLYSASLPLGWSGTIQSGVRKPTQSIAGRRVSFGRDVPLNAQPSASGPLLPFGERTLTPREFLGFLAKNTDGLLARLQFQGLKLWAKLGPTQAASLCGPLPELRARSTARHEVAHALIASAVQTPPRGLFVYRLGRVAGGVIYPDRLHSPKTREDFRRKLLVLAAGLVANQWASDAASPESPVALKERMAYNVPLGRVRKDICDFVETLRLGADRKWIRAGQDLESLPEDMDYETWGQLCEKMKKSSEGKYPLSKGERRHYLDMKSAFSRAIEMPIMQDAMRVVTSALNAVPSEARTALIETAVQRKVLTQTEWESLLGNTMPVSAWAHIQVPLRAFLEPSKDASERPA